ncbi:MAG: hypothetical protein HYT88_03920 [Candidatus Omnitrophica bacterium]|nr:hypothetical protein [Candidatus Omnitrophota bacterium]
MAGGRAHQSQPLFLCRARQDSSLIHHAALAIRHSLTARQLMRTITAHPTLSEGLTEAAAALYGESLCVASRSSMGSSATRSAS